jgi:flagellar biosynthesis GTPase FlhF
MSPERFYGRTAATALAAVRRALGDDAVLIETHGTRDGGVEILAAPPGAAAAEPRGRARRRGGRHAGRGEDHGPRQARGRPRIVGACASRSSRRTTHRVAATAELDAIGRALGVLVVRATTPAAVESTIARLDGVDRVFVDTTGAGPAHMATLAEVAAFARSAGEDAERALVVSATTAPAIVSAALRAFELVRPTSAIVAKADCAPWEPIASQIAGHGISACALGKSRSVADSLTLVGTDGLARRLLAA